MRLKQYITEAMTKDIDDIDKIVDLIKKDCKYYLKKLKKDNGINFLYRGVRNKGEFFKGNVRKRRQPSDSSPELHKEMNAGFKRKFGINARSETLFCTASTGRRLVTRGGFGKNYAIFPIGNFSVIYSDDISDLFVEADRQYDISINSSRYKSKHPWMITYDDIEKYLSPELKKDKTLKFAITVKFNMQPEEIRILTNGRAYPENDIILKGKDKNLIKKWEMWKKWQMDDYIYDYEMVKHVPNPERRRELMVVCDQYYAISIEYLKRHAGISNALGITVE